MIRSITKINIMLSIVIMDLFLVTMSKGVGMDIDGESALKFRIGVARYRDNGEYYQGEPILIHIQIGRNKTDTDNKKILLIGTKELPWYENIAVHVYRIEQAPANGPDNISKTATAPPNISGRTMKDGDELEAREVVETKMILLKEACVAKQKFQPKKNNLSENEIARSFWSINPTITSKWPAGKYVIKAVYDAADKYKSNPNIFCGKLQSNEVTIVVNEPNNDQTKANILVLQAEYIMNQQKYDDAIKLYEQVLQLNPAKKEVCCHLGRAYELKGDNKNAIVGYQAYVNWVRSLNRPRTGKNDINNHADIIESKIKLLKTKIENKKNKQ